LKGKMVLIDGHSLAHRAFFALPPLTTGRGEPTNAVYGVVMMTLRLLEEENPDYFLAAFDVGKTFRHEAYEGYKKNRREPDADFLAQLPGIKKFFACAGAAVVGVEGYEADDVIGTMSAKARAAGLEVVVVSGDRDFFQLIDEMVTVLYTRRGITEVERVTVDWIREKYGLTPAQLIDFKALTGDPSDNVPGVPGVGEKTALRLLKEFGGVDDLLNRVEEVKSPREKRLISSHAEQVRESKKLVTIVKDVELPVSIADCRRREPEPEVLAGFFRDMEFKSLLKKMFPKEKGAQMSVPEFQMLGAEDLPEFLAGAGGEPVALQFLAAGADWGRGIALGAAFSLPSGVHGYLPLTRKNFPEELARWLANSRAPKICHNAKLQMTLTHHYGVVWQGLVFDTEIAGYLLRGGLGGTNLGRMYRDFLGGPDLPEIEDKKGKILDIFSLPPEYSADPGLIALPAVARATVINELRPVFEERLRNEGLEKLYYQIELPLVQVLFAIEKKGIKVSPERLHLMQEKLTAKIDALEKKIYTLAGEEFNISSPKQLGKVLFERLKLPRGRKTKTGYSTDAGVLEELAAKHPVVRMVLDYRGLLKLKTTYVDSLLNLAHLTRRIHTTFQQTVTATGRLSSTDPNLQNIPVRNEEGREIRCCFVPGSPEEVFVSADYSQIELRILAHLSGDEKLMSAFREGADIHSRTAAEIFNLSAEEVTPVWRNRAKAVNFGIIYGISPFGLARGTGVSRQEAEEYIKAYFQRYQGVKTFLDEVITRARREGYVTTIFNRRRFLPELAGKNFQRRSFAERMARNTPIQGSAADLIKLAMVRVDERLRREKIPAAVLLQVHDELLVETERQFSRRVADILREEMESVYSLAVPLPVEIKTGDNWGEMAVCPVHA